MMANPFIVWTFQRTGGTSFANALFLRSSFPRIEHEPFNPGRALGYISKAIGETAGQEKQSGLSEVLNSGTLLKHCFELHDHNFNLELLNKLASRPGYKHIVLMRKSETDRLLSLFLARQTGVWGKPDRDNGGYDKWSGDKGNIKPFPIPEMLQHGVYCLAYEKWLLDELQNRGIDFMHNYFEDLYEGPGSVRVNYINSVFDYVGMPGIDVSNDESLIKKLFHSAQESENWYGLIPNIEETRRALNDMLERESTISESVDYT